MSIKWKLITILSVVILTFSTVSPIGFNRETMTWEVTQAKANNQTYEYPFRNPDLPLETRVNDLISRLTLDEKISLLHQYQPAIPRLGIPPFRTGTEALHGVAWLGEATVFPQATGLANTWDVNLIKQVGSAVGDEVRAFHKRNPAFNGLSVWAPVVDLQRDPRAGRNEEAYGEDPYLTGQISTAYAAGLKGDHPFYWKTIPTLKHFLGYNNETNRGSSSSSIDPRNMYEYYLKSFEPAIRAGAAHSLMPAYNAINGRPALLSPLINHLVKKEWAKDEFFVVSDAYDPTGTVNDHHYTDSYPEAMALAIKAGVDSLTDQDNRSHIIINYIKEALSEGFLTEEDIDKAVKNVLSVRFRLGEFDPPERNPYANISEDVINSPEHQKLALEAARKQLVLLKNNGILPLNKEKINKIAVIGPLADQVFTDFYSGTLPYAVSTLEGIEQKIPKEKIAFSRGVDQIALKSVLTKKYVSADPDGKTPLRANADRIGPNETFDVYDFGWGQYMFRAHANDKYVSNAGGSKHVTNNAEPPGTQDWFTYENYKYEKQNDNTYAIYNYQVGHWDTGLTGGKYITVGDSAPHYLTAEKESVTGPAEKFEQVLLVDGEEDAAEKAKNADAAIVVVGDEPQLNSRETLDRTDITLPPAQEALIQKVASVNPNTIVVLISGDPMAMPKVQNNPNVKAILYSAHGGQEEGRAIADALFGDYAPAGRLNQTWYASVDQLPDIMEYDIIKGKRTYQYFDGKPLYPFGHGLTYTDFKYSNLRLSSGHIDANDTVKVSVDVTNTGSRKSDEVVQLYTRANQSRVKRPIKELKGFQRLTFEPHETKTVTFELPASAFEFWDVTRSKYVVESGTYTIMVGRSSEDIRLTKTLTIKGEKIPDRDLTKLTKAVNYDDYSGVKIVESSKNGSEAVGEVDPGDWIAFHDVKFKNGLSQFVARVASGSQGGQIEIRLDHPTKGKLIGTAVVPSTGDFQKWTTVKATVDHLHGVHDVYLKFNGEIHIDWLLFK